MLAQVLLMTTCCCWVAAAAEQQVQVVCELCASPLPRLIPPLTPHPCVISQVRAVSPECHEGHDGQ
jgi:hypothetical protein